MGASPLHTRESDFDGATALTVGPWRDTQGMGSINALIRHSAFVGTILVEGSYDGKDLAASGADFTIFTATPGAVQNVNAITVPFVRLRISVYTSGTVDAAFLYARP